MERDQILHVVEAEIGRLGGEVDGVRQAKGGHRMIYWTTRGGKKIATTVQAYTGNWRSIRHARSNIRRALR